VCQIDRSVNSAYAKRKGQSPNPVVSDGGRYTAFQTARAGGAAGAGRGTFLYDPAKAPKAKR
jgi:hypothetical protein